MVQVETACVSQFKFFWAMVFIKCVLIALYELKSVDNGRRKLPT